MNKINAEIIAVGTEIMLGDINNSHAKYISEMLGGLGINVCYHTAVGDNPKRLKEVFSSALMRSDLIITTGGLGPTDDDLTKETVCEIAGVPLVEDKKAAERIKEYFAKSGRDCPECNKKQALVPDGAIILYNENGTAPGLILEAQNRIKIIIMLPGPPNELHPMFEQQVVPYLKLISQDVIHSVNLKTVGIGESRIQQLLDDILGAENPSIALYASPNEVRIRITAKAESLEKAKEMIAPVREEIEQRLGDAIYTDSGETLAETVVRLLKQKGLKVSTAESCTGGLIAEKITNVPGASEVFEYGISSYSNRIKQTALSVSEKSLYLYGEVSEQVAVEMAKGIKKKSGSQLAAAVTGFAGPSGGNRNNPAGTVYIAVIYGEYVWTRRLSSGRNDRASTRETAAVTALDMIRHILINSRKSALYLTPLRQKKNTDPVIKQGVYYTKFKKFLRSVFPYRGESTKSILSKFTIYAAAAVFIVSAAMIAGNINEKIQSDIIISKTQNLYTEQPTPEEITKLPYGYLEKFAGLYSVNQDIRGWISLNGTNINFPVVQAKDNEYYLDHNFYREYNQNGLPFADYRNSFSEYEDLDDNTVIYAHNIRGDRFFSELTKYTDLSFYKQHPIIRFDTVYDESEWLVIAAYITNAEPEEDDGSVFEYHNYLNFEMSSDFDWYIEQLRRRSVLNIIKSDQNPNGIDVEYGDKLLTLSTCTYDFNEARFVVVARKLRDGESADKDFSFVKLNQNPLYPQAWYDKNGGTKPEFIDTESGSGINLNDFDISKFLSSTPDDYDYYDPDDKHADVLTETENNTGSGSPQGGSFNRGEYYMVSSKRSSYKKKPPKKNTSSEKTESKKTSSQNASSKNSSSKNSSSSKPADKPVSSADKTSSAVSDAPESQLSSAPEED